MIRNLKQEAGEVTTVDGSALDFSKYKIGGFLRLLPWHSCAVAHQHASLYAVEDDGDEAEVVAEWQRARGW